MNKKQTIGLVVAAGLFILIGVSSVLTNTFSQKALDERVYAMRPRTTPCILRTATTLNTGLTFLP